MRLLFIVSIAFFSINLNAQFYNGSITLNDGEKLTGLIEFNYDNGINYMQSEDDDDFLAISADDIRLVQATINDIDENFVFLDAPFALSKKNESESIRKRLFRIMAQGRVTLLEYTPSSALLVLSLSEITVLYVKKTDSETPKMFSYIQKSGLISGEYRNSHFKEFTTEYFSDCAILVEKINNDDLSAEHSLEVVEFYNNDCN
ncbi:hypothetical protein GWA97_06105 [Flavobacterium sp. LaA7.5]|nr:hypothetical protein [Flavobacterium salilacus subsp. altitudinum]